MQDPNVDDIGRRLSQLEREHRALKWSGLVGATLQNTPAVAEEIRARRFVLMDPAGKQRGVWAVFPDTVDLETFELKQQDMVALDMRTKGNTARMAVAAESAGVSFSNLTGARALTVMRSDGTVGTTMSRSGAGRQETLAIRVKPDGEAGFSLQDDDGRSRIQLSVASDGSPYLSFLDQRARPSIALEASQSTRRLVLADQGGAVRLALSTLSNGRPVVLLLDAKGNQRAQISILEDGSPSIALFDADKSVVWNEP